MFKTILEFFLHVSAMQILLKLCYPLQKNTSWHNFDLF